MNRVVMSTQFGNLAIEEIDSKITSLQFTEEPEAGVLSDIQKKAVGELNQYLDGERKTFDFPINLTGTEFQKKVWNELKKIPYGVTISYQELANRLGDPLCIRAAASANGKNPLAIIIPCHRVIGSDGSMTGYAGGIQRKKGLLQLEGAAVMRQMNMF